MKKQLVLLLFFICYFSCASQRKEVIAKSTIKLERENTNIQDLINIDGYYTNPSTSQYGSYMFFKDGTWVYFHFQSGMSEKEKQTNMTKSVTNWIEDRQIQWGYYWGVYTIQNDTIIVHSYDKSALLKGWSLGENRYKSIDKNTIQRIYYRSILKSADDYYKTNSPWRDDEPMRFTPADTLPSSDNWLKEKKWTWRNESDWRAYMQHVEQIKKQFKKK
jgi:hypothetical protein